MNTSQIDAARTVARVPVARLLRPQGRRGELLALPLTDVQEAFAPGTAITLETPSDSGRPPAAPVDSIIEERWFPTGKNAGRIVLKLAGADSIAAAEAIAGCDVTVPAAALPVLDADTFYVGDLVDSTLLDHGTPVGTIVDVEFPMTPDGRARLPDAAPLLAVTLTSTPDADPVLVPFVRAWLLAVDTQSRQVRMNLPAGLLGGAESVGAPEPAE